MSTPVVKEFVDLVNDHASALTDACWNFLEETGVAEHAPDGSTNVHGLGPHNLLPVVENLAFHLAVWSEFAKQVGVSEQNVLELARKGAERGREAAADMGTVFTDGDDPSN